MQNPLVTVSFDEQELRHIDTLIQHKAKSGYEDGIAGAQCSLNIIAKINMSARQSQEKVSQMNEAIPPVATNVKDPSKKSKKPNKSG